MNVDTALLLLDPAAMAARVRRHPALGGRTPREVAFDTLWIKPGSHFNVCYRLTFDADPCQMRCAAFALDPRRAERIAAETGRCAHGDADGSCVSCATYVAEPGLLLQLFPHDYRLPTLPQCLDAGRVARALASAECNRCTPAGYRPGMRCQIRYEFADGSLAFGKVAVEDDPGRAARLHARIVAAYGVHPRGFRLARPLGYCAELRLSLVAAVGGRSVYDALRDRVDLRQAMARIARAVAEFHQLDVEDVTRSYTADHEVRLLTGWVTLVGRLYPTLEAGLHAGLVMLQESVPAAAAPRALVHRDFYDKQVLLDEEVVSLLDMDTACRGDPEIDLGNFSAQLRLRGLQWNQSAACRDLEAGFLAAYPVTIERARLDWYRRATLLRLACGYAVRPHWHHLAPALCAAMGRP